MAGNSNSGRRPLPTALKIARGNPGKRPLNMSEPKPPKSDGNVPSCLSSGAKKLWRKLAPAMVADGRLTIESENRLAAYCENETTYQNLLRKVRRGAAKFDRETLPLLRHLQAEGRSVEAEFGMTPSARSKVDLGGKPKDALEEFCRIKHG